MADRIGTLFTDFKNSSDTLRIYLGDECIFKSDRDVLAPLLEYILEYKKGTGGTTLMDKVMGNAAALLSVKAGAVRIYSPLGSELASATLNKYNIEHHLERIVPFVLARNGKDMCPMEKLSLHQSPDDFLEILKLKSYNKNCR